MAGENGCGLVCMQEVEVARPRPRWLDLYAMRVASLDSGMDVEIVDGTKRLSAFISNDDVHELYRFMLDEKGVELFGSKIPTVTALYTIKALRDAATRWLRGVESERRRIQKILKEAEEKADEHRRLREHREKLLKEYREIKSRDEEKAAKLWKMIDDIDHKLLWDKFCIDEEKCMRPSEAARLLRAELERLEEMEKRLMIAATALSHAWRAMTHPSIEDLERFYNREREQN